MSKPSADTLPRNTTGALIFSAYVFSALFLTIFITRSHFIAFYSRKSTPLKNRNAGQSTRLLIYTSLSLLSFSVLSYNMLSFLIVSYTAWAQERHIALPKEFFGSDRALLGVLRGVTGGLMEKAVIRVEVWEWLTTSTLFQDFARDICDDWARYTWTCLALVDTMGVGMWMASEGTSTLMPFLVLKYVHPNTPQLSTSGTSPNPPFHHFTTPLHTPYTQNQSKKTLTEHHSRPPQPHPTSMGILRNRANPTHLIRPEPLLRCAPSLSLIITHSDLTHIPTKTCPLIPTFTTTLHNATTNTNHADLQTGILVP